MNALSSEECRVCGSTQLVTIPDSGEIVCEHCGAVSANKLIAIRIVHWQRFIDY